ncbi:hypothetical protein Leryth_024752 [Lithospermum erythrorhizon]|nr:hypothetical protein Leryth_024752 [Lithospermum erythrorhizon]
MIGGRKALATTSTDQENKAVTMIDGMSANGVNMKKCSKQSETDLASINKPEEQFHRVVSNRTKRKGSILASKSKRSMIENGYMTKLKLTLKEAQGLISPPPGNNPKVIVIEGFELEEYEDVPIIGRPSILSSDYTGEEIQWVQCDDCLKWRKVPTKILLPSKWTCSANLLDQEKSMCSAAQELTAEHLTDVFLAISNGMTCELSEFNNICLLVSVNGLLPGKGAIAVNHPSSKKSSVSKPDSDSVETLEALNALANIALQEGALLHATTRHPRHKPGCSCIVCMQPPSGKGPKHRTNTNHDCVVQNL